MLLVLLVGHMLKQRLALGKVLAQQLVFLQNAQVLDLLCSEAHARGCGVMRLRHHALGGCCARVLSGRRGWVICARAAGGVLRLGWLERLLGRLSSRWEENRANGRDRHWHWGLDMDERHNLHLNPQVRPGAVVEHALLKLEAEAARAKAAGGVVEEIAHPTLHVGHSSVDGKCHERERAKYHAELDSKRQEKFHERIIPW